jgi:hypothetical protein
LLRLRTALQVACQCSLPLELLYLQPKKRETSGYKVTSAYQHAGSNPELDSVSRSVQLIDVHSAPSLRPSLASSALYDAFPSSACASSPACSAWASSFNTAHVQ